MMCGHGRDFGLSALKTSLFTQFFVVPLTLVALLSGCYWAVPNEAPATFVAFEQPSKVRLTLTDGRRPVVENLTLTEGAISGLVEDSLMAFPFEDIAQLERQRFAWYAPLAVGVLAGSIVGLIVLKDACEDFGC